MEERCAVEQLLDYPKEKGLHYETSKRSNKRSLLMPSYPMTKSKYVLFKKGELIFLHTIRMVKHSQEFTLYRIMILILNAKLPKGFGLTILEQEKRKLV